MRRLALLATVAALAFPAQAGACFYKDPSPNKSESAWMAIRCWADSGFWVNGSGVTLVQSINSTAWRWQMTRGLRPKALVDWDPASGGPYPLPAGYWVDVYQ